MNHVFLILGAVLAPFAIHEFGHFAIATANGIPLVWGWDRWRLVWSIHSGATPSESVRRQIAIAGFWAEVLGAVIAVAMAGAVPVLSIPSAVYAGVTMAHLWTYAVLQDGPYDDFAILRPRCGGGCSSHDS